MARSPRLNVRCPYAKPEDTCMLPPGVRYCVCYSDQHRDHAGQVAIVGGQLVWSVLSGGRPRGFYSYVAVVRQGATLTPIELQDEASVRETVENGRALYIVRGPRDQRYEIEAAALVEAALDGREMVDAVAATH